MPASSIQKGLIGDNAAKDDAGQVRGHGGGSSELRTRCVLVGEAIARVGRNELNASGSHGSATDEEILYRRRSDESALQQRRRNV